MFNYTCEARVSPVCVLCAGFLSSKYFFLFPFMCSWMCLFRFYSRKAFFIFFIATKNGSVLFLSSYSLVSFFIHFGWNEDRNDTKFTEKEKKAAQRTFAQCSRQSHTMRAHTHCSMFMFIENCITSEWSLMGDDFWAPRDHKMVKWRIVSTVLFTYFTISIVDFVFFLCHSVCVVFLSLSFFCWIVASLFRWLSSPMFQFGSITKRSRNQSQIGVKNKWRKWCKRYTKEMW